MTALLINGVTLLLIVYSVARDRRRTVNALEIAARRGLSLLPMMLVVTVLIGLILGFFPPEAIRTYLGGEMSLLQVSIAALVGAVTMIPSLVSLPLAGSMIASGASYTTIAAFLTTLTMVGFATLPLELKELGKGITLLRNGLAFCFAVLVAVSIGLLM